MSELAKFDLSRANQALLDKFSEVGHACSGIQISVHFRLPNTDEYFVSGYAFIGSQKIGYTAQVNSDYKVLSLNADNDLQLDEETVNAKQILERELDKLVGLMGRNSYEIGWIRKANNGEYYIAKVKVCEALVIYHVFPMENRVCQFIPGREA